MPKSNTKTGKRGSTKSPSLLSPPPLPVTILSGFLGAGKTTLLKHVLESQQHKKKIAVIVNDMAELNIDSSLVEKSGLVHTKQEVVSMQNGCICCTLRTDLIREVSRLQKLGTFDYLLIESTGISEPMQVAESFCADPHTEELADNPKDMLWNTARLDTLVTVVDANEFPAMMNSLDQFKEKFASETEENDAEGEKHISQLLLEQVEFANVIVLNKCDLIDERRKESVLALIKSLNPSAKILPSSYSSVNLHEILNTKLFDMEKAQAAPGWLQSLNQKGSTEGGFQVAAAASESTEYGVSSFVYKSRSPFHPERLHTLLSSIFNFYSNKKSKATGLDVAENPDIAKQSLMLERFGWILRSKGFCWIAGRDEMMAEWAQAGRFVSITPLMEWYVDVPEEEWPVDAKEEIASIRANFKSPYGDRRQELVFIGADLRRDDLAKALDDCLLTEAELEAHRIDATDAYFDPLPQWIRKVDDPDTMLAATLRDGVSHSFTVADGLQVEVSNISLDYVAPYDGTVEDENDSLEFDYRVKVWLDIAKPLHSSLLCTLSPGRCEQTPISLTLSRTDDAKPYSLRMESEALKRKNDPSSMSLSTKRKCPYQVHVLGISSISTGYEEAEADGDENNSCPLPSKS